MKYLLQQIKVQKKNSYRSPKSEQGIALVLALMMGFLLIAGSSALLVRKLVERKVGAFISYQQMAENAAMSGFNHILSQLNNPNSTQYRGYLYSINNIPGSNTEWTNISSPIQTTGIDLEEMCTPTEASYALPPHPDNKIWPIDLVPLTEDKNQNTLRDDGSEPVLASYRLREYNKNFASDKALGVFSIEGLVTRKGTVLARTLLTRSLDIKFVVANPEDWAIINAALFNNLGNVRINGEGIIALNTDQYWTKNCNQFALEREIGDSVSGSTSPLIWPIRERGIPGPVLYEEDRANDFASSNNRRVWSFDDSGSIDRGINCTEIACIRDEQWSSIDDFIDASATGLTKSNEQARTVIIKSDQICKGADPESPCHLNIEHLNISNTKIMIENERRPVVIHLLSLNSSRPEPSVISTGSIKLEANSLFCGVDSDSTECNQKPERFIITNAKDDGDYYSGCASTQGVLDIGGEAMPAAWIGLQSGTVKLNSNTTLRGVLWAQNICGNGHNLTVDSSSIIEESEKVWKWRENNLWGGNGRQTIRGVRGSGNDLFEKF